MNALDSAVVRFMADHRVGFVTWLARRLMDLGGSPLILGLVGILGVGYVLVAQRWRLALAAGGTFIASSVLAALLKSIIGRARPPAGSALVHLAGSSMPSTHALRTAAVASAVIGTLTWVEKRSRRAIAAALFAGVVLVGASMLYLGGHWLSDVLVGWALGVAVGATAAFSVRTLFPEQHHRLAHKRRDAALKEEDFEA